MLAIAVAIIAVVGDRLAASAAQRAVAIKIREVALLHGDPSVTIAGFPFLTQALRGRYGKITVTAHDIHRDGVRIDTVTGTFYGVHLGLRDALAGRVTAVPIDRETGSILITYPDLDAYLSSRHLHVTPAGNDLQVAGDPVVAGHQLAVSGTYSVGVVGRELVFTPVRPSLRANGAALSGSVASAAATALVVRIDTGSLPFGISITSAVVRPTGIEVDGAAHGLAVPVPADAATNPGA